MLQTLKPPIRLGILGGGQLAQMICNESLKHLNLPIHAYLLSPNEPAAWVVNGQHSIGLLSNESPDLKKFLTHCDTVIFENEFVDTQTLASASQGLPVKFAPSLAAISRVRDKCEQKQISQELGIESAPFVVFNHEKGSAEEWLTALLQTKDRHVLKWSLWGYDGKGTFFFDRPQIPAALEFIVKGLELGARIYAEEHIPFRRELAVVATRSEQRKEFCFYPLVISEQMNGICHRVTGPATSLGVDPRLEQQAQLAARRIGDFLNLEGSYAIEFFETLEGRLLVNEIAPRVHNSGHFSLNASHTSQFENHVRAVAGLPLGSTLSAPFFAMLNFLGPGDLGEIKIPPGANPFQQKLPLGVEFTWYFKESVRPGRKMGHFNIKADSSHPNAIQRALEALKEAERSFQQALRELSEAQNRKVPS